MPDQTATPTSSVTTLPVPPAVPVTKTEHTNAIIDRILGTALQVILAFTSHTGTIKTRVHALGKNYRVTVIFTEDAPEVPV